MYSVQDEKMYPFGWISDAVVNEKQLEWNWFQYKAGDIIQDTNGEAILIIDLGVSNRNEGPDIRNTILFSNGRLLKGDIEIHRRSREWFYHGHENDPNYNNVILHIVHQLDRDDHRLKGQIHCMGQVKGAHHCSLNGQNISDSFQSILVKLGLNRFQENVNRYRHHAWQNYALEDLCNLLGKGGNEAAFRLLLFFYKIEGKTDHSIQWHKRGIRPNAWPEKRVDMALELFSYFLRLNGRPSTVPTDINAWVSGHFLTELKGNILYPLMGAKALVDSDYNAYRQVKSEWLTLKMNGPYGRFKKKFGQVLPNPILKNFAISQGLLWLENHWCTLDHCGVCPLKDFHGTPFQN